MVSLGLGVIPSVKRLLDRILCNNRIGEPVITKFGFQHHDGNWFKTLVLGADPNVGTEMARAAAQAL